MAIDLKKIAKAVLLSQLSTIILIGIFGIFAYFGKVTENTANIVTLGLIVISLIFATFILAKNIERAGLINGLVTSALFFLITAVISAIIKGRFSISEYEVTRLVMMLSAGMLGGVLGINA